MIITMLLTTFSISFAQMNAKQGIEFLKTNFENAQSNIESYKKGLAEVEFNLIEVNKAKQESLNYQNNISLSLKESQKQISNLEKLDNQTVLNIAKETKNKQEDLVKISELEKLLAALKEKQIKHDSNITHYQNQLREVKQTKLEWRNRQDELKSMSIVAKTKVQSINKIESEWKTKKKGYEAEIAKWEKETEKHQKIYDESLKIAGP